MGVWTLRFNLVLGLMLAWDLQAADKSSGTEFKSKIKLWTRAPGAYWDDRDPKPLGEKEYLVKSQVRAKLFDIQYGEEVEVRGEFLHEIVESYKPAAANCDGVILHFNNGMQVPIPLSLMARGKVEIMLAVAKKEGKIFGQSFPKLSKPSNEWRDPRPILFQSNKLVLSQAWHPGYGEIRPQGFNPFHHVDSLSGMEWISVSAYEKQFHLADSTSAGQSVYLRRCQFCHNIHGLGARFGWDFAGPIKIYEKRNPSSLHNHVSFEKLDALERGLMMPAQKDFTEAEALDLWSFMKMAAQKVPLNYTP